MASCVQVEGDFQRQDAVSLCDSNGQEFARGLVNFDSHELERLKVRQLMTAQLRVYSIQSMPASLGQAAEM